MFSLEYQAVILAGGRGTRMTEITSSKAKCLLPIGNYPMIWYPLNMLKRIGFHGKLIIRDILLTGFPAAKY